MSSRLSSKGMATRGEGVVAFMVVFMLVVMMCSSMDVHCKLAKAVLAVSASSFVPSQVHLALTKNPNEMIVSFHTENYDRDQLGLAQVMYSKNENFNDYQVASIGSVSTTYGDSAKTGYEHHVLLRNLEYSTKYYYKCGFFTKSSDIVSDVFYFHTRTDPNSPESKQVSVLMYGDQGTTKSAFVIARTKHFVKSFYDKSDSKHKNMFVYHLGDIGYANDFAGAQFQYIWNKYMNMLSGFMPYAPYMVCVGNHERGPKHHPYDEFEYPFNAYNSRFYMPGRNESTIGHNMWHVFEYGPIAFVAIDTETNFPGAQYGKYIFNGEQLKWFEETLASVDRKKTPWLIVVGHRPIYSSTNEFSDEQGNPIGESKTLQDAFEDLIYKYKTDIVMVGHVHSYERTYPVYKTKVESKTNFHNLRSPVHIVNGGGGNIEGQTKPETYLMNHDWTADIFYKDEGYGILYTNYDAKTKVHSIKFDYHESKTGLIVDTVTISKDE